MPAKKLAMPTANSITVEVRDDEEIGCVRVLLDPINVPEPVPELVPVPVVV